MFQVQIPQEMPPEELDRRMARGWFRSGPVFFRAELFCIEDAVWDLVHVRLPLERYAPGKSRRRLLRRNRERFRCAIGPASVDDARRELYEGMKPRFMGFVSRDLEPLVFGLTPGVFDTHECCVYDGDRLVAVSYFDVGRRSAASELSLHDPAYARFGLGIYTLMEEIEFARERGIRFFYPGYVVPGLDMFDYKLSVSPVQYLGTDGRWRARSRPPQRSPRSRRFSRRHREARDALASAGVEAHYRLYPGFWLSRLAVLGRTAHLSAPAHLRCGPQDADRLWVVEYDIDDDVFQLILAEVDHQMDLMSESEPYDPGVEIETRALARVSTALRSRSVEEIARAAAARVT